MPKELKSDSSISADVISKLNADIYYSRMISYISTLIQKAANSEAIGFRLSDGNDFPYYFSHGFSEEHIQEEMYVRYIDQYSKYTPCFECLCGYVLSGEMSCEMPCFTSYGSLCINCSNDLAALAKNWKNKKYPIRGLCLREGYESIALIPVKSHDRVYGLFQLNDKRINVFAGDVVACLEAIAACLAVLFDNLFKADIMHAVFLRYQTLEQLAKKVEVGSDSAIDRNIIISELYHLLYPLEDIHGIISSCCCCKRISCNNSDWISLEEYVSRHSHLSFSHTYCPDCFKSEFKKL